MVAENRWSVEPSTVVKMLTENRHDSCGIPWGLPRRWQTKRGIRTSLILSCYCHWSPKPVWFWGLYGYREQFNYFLVFRNPKIAARVLTYVKMEPESDDDDSDDNDNHNTQGEQVLAQPTVNISEVLTSVESVENPFPLSRWSWRGVYPIKWYKYLVTIVTKTFEKLFIFSITNKVAKILLYKVYKRPVFV